MKIDNLLLVLDYLFLLEEVCIISLMVEASFSSLPPFFFMQTLVVSLLYT